MRDNISTSESSPNPWGHLSSWYSSDLHTVIGDRSIYYVNWETLVSWRKNYPHAGTPKMMIKFDKMINRNYFDRSFFES